MDDVAEQADAIGVQVRRAVALSDTLLDVARAEVGGVTLERHSFDLVPTARQIIAEIGAISSHHLLRLDAPETVPCIGDERRLGRVLRNLLENAVKYAPAESGPVVLSLQPRTAANGAPEIVIAVRDSGVGVPNDQLAQLFDRQYRASNAVGQGIQGSGLGLYIVRQIVEAHGGHVWAESADEGGLSVLISLPG